MKSLRMLGFCLALLMIGAASHAQLKKVNEECDQMPCESGLTCVELKSGKKKCSLCDQSTSNSMTENVDNACKAFGEGWTPESNDDYKDALAADGRVLVDVYDKMLENAKKCKEARENRESKCWGGGDDDHKKAIQQVADGIQRMADHKYRMIGAKRVYYGSKSTYESRLSTFKSKADLNFPDMNQKLDIMNNDQDKGNKVNCSDIERIRDDAERCVNAAKDLLYDGFSNSLDKFPDEYNDVFTKAMDTMKKAKDLLDTVKNKSLCN
ncbi:MAG TPA: hypothetical protein VL832_00685 [Puia sp.]|nr:hypothetical protein [Puia sp.]